MVMFLQARPARCAVSGHSVVGAADRVVTVSLPADSVAHVGWDRGGDGWGGVATVWPIDWQLFFEFLKTNSDTPSKYEVRGKTKSCKVPIESINI